MSTGPQIYPGANTAHWYQDKYSSDSMETNVVVWHSTEGTSLPDYSGGSIAPNLTAVPDFKAQKLVWYQHFDFDRSSRALVNLTGGVETNTLNVVQVEIVGTCDPATHKKWGTTPHLYMPDLPDWAVRDLAAFAKWAHDTNAVPLTSAVSWKAYDASYGTGNGVRLSMAQWESFKGHCGHEHVPENVHGDPGLFPMAAILAKATAAPAKPATGTGTPAKPVYQPFPGAAWFTPGRTSLIVGAMHDRLVVVGCNRYKSTANKDTIGSGDVASYEAWQRHLGYTGSAAEWPPGKTSWDKLQVKKVV